MKYNAKDFAEFEQESFEEIEQELRMLQDAIRKRNYEMITHHAKNIMMESIKAEQFEYVSEHIE